MNSRLTTIAVLLTAFLGAGSALAQDGELVAGKITALNLNDGVGSMTIRETATNRLRSFEVTPQTQVTVRRDAVGSALKRTVSATPGDLAIGDRVKLDVKSEMDGRVVVVGYEVLPVVVPAASAARNEPAPAANDNIVARNDSGNADYRYDTLPATASPLPLLAAFGAGALLLAGALRLRRVRGGQ